MPGEITPAREFSRSTDKVASVIFENVATYVHAMVGTEVWAEIQSEVAGVTDMLRLNDIPVRPNEELEPRRVLIIIGSFIVANFSLPPKAVVPPVPARTPDPTVSH